MWDGRRREKAAAAPRRQTRFNSNGVMGIRSAMPQRRQFIILINAKGAEKERGRVQGAGYCTKKTIKNLRDTTRVQVEWMTALIGRNGSPIDT